MKRPLTCCLLIWEGLPPCCHLSDLDGWPVSSVVSPHPQNSFEGTMSFFFQELSILYSTLDPLLPHLPNPKGLTILVGCPISHIQMCNVRSDVHLVMCTEIWKIMISYGPTSFPSGWRAHLLIWWLPQFVSLVVSLQVFLLIFFVLCCRYLYFPVWVWGSNFYLVFDFVCVCYNYNVDDSYIVFIVYIQIEKKYIFFLPIVLDIVVLHVISTIHANFWSRKSKHKPVLELFLPVRDGSGTRGFGHYLGIILRWWTVLVSCWKNWFIFPEGY